MPENRIVWKYDNQGVKEETFIQTSRRGGDQQPGWRGLMARWWLKDWGRHSHIFVWINQEEQLGSKTDLAT